MSIEQQIETAWKEYVNDMDEDVRRTVAFHSDVFEAGYKAALRGMWRVVPEDEVQTGVQYTIAVRAKDELLWRDYAMVSLSDNSRIVIEDPRIPFLDIVPKERFCIEDVKIFLLPNPNDIPSPTEVFGEEVSQ